MVSSVNSLILLNKLSILIIDLIRQENIKKFVKIVKIYYFFFFFNIIIKVVKIKTKQKKNGRGCVVTNKTDEDDV